MAKGAEAFRSIGEVADQIGVASHVLRYWETQFPSLKPMKRPDGRRYYRPADVDLAAGICALLRDDGLTIRGALKLIAADRGAAVRRRGAGYLAARTNDPNQPMLDLEARPDIIPRDPLPEPAPTAPVLPASDMGDASMPEPTMPEPTMSVPSTRNPANGTDPGATMPGGGDPAPLAHSSSPQVAAASAPETDAASDPDTSSGVGPAPGDADHAPLQQMPSAAPSGGRQTTAWLWQLTLLARHLQQADASDPRWTRLRPAAARLAHAMLSLS